MKLKFTSQFPYFWSPENPTSGFPHSSLPTEEPFSPRKMTSVRYWALQCLKKTVHVAVRKTSSNLSAEQRRIKHACSQNLQKAGVWCKTVLRKLSVNNASGGDPWRHHEHNSPQIKDPAYESCELYTQESTFSVGSPWKTRLAPMAKWVRNWVHPAKSNPANLFRLPPSDASSDSLFFHNYDPDTRLFPEPPVWNGSFETDSTISKNIEGPQTSPGSTLTNSLSSAFNSIAASVLKSSPQSPPSDAAWSVLKLSEDLVVSTESASLTSTFKNTLRDFQLAQKKLGINNRLKKLETALDHVEGACFADLGFAGASHDLMPYWDLVKELEISINLVFEILSAVQKKYSTLVDQMRFSPLSRGLLQHLEGQFIDLQHSIVNVHGLTTKTHDIFLALRTKIEKQVAHKASIHELATRDSEDTAPRLARMVFSVLKLQQGLQEATEQADDLVFTVLMRIINHSNHLEAE